MYVCVYVRTYISMYVGVYVYTYVRMYGMYIRLGSVHGRWPTVGDLLLLLFTWHVYVRTYIRMCYAGSVQCPWSLVLGLFAALTECK